jgi:preprotein translocase subunit YajC
LGSFGFLIVIIAFAFLWFVLIRPQKKRQLQQQRMLSDLSVGDEIVTAGGLYGVITQVDGEVLHLEIADGLVVRTARNAVAGIVEVEEEEVEEGEEAEEERASEDAIDADGEPEPAQPSAPPEEATTEPPRTTQ